MKKNKDFLSSCKDTSDKRSYFNSIQTILNYFKEIDDEKKKVKKRKTR